MRTLFSAFRAAAAVVLMAGAVISASAQGDERRLAEAKAQIGDYLRYFKFESKFSAKEIDRLVNDSGAKAPGGSTPLGNLGVVEKRGRGPIPMILIADIRTDWSLYRNFMDRNVERYTMYAVTLPGYGGTPAPPRPETLDLKSTPWWDGAEKGVVSLIEKNRFNKPVVVGP